MNPIKKYNGFLFVLFFVLFGAEASPPFNERVYDDDGAAAGVSALCLPADLPDDASVSVASWSTTAALLELNRQAREVLGKTNPSFRMGGREAFLALKETAERARLSNHYNNERDLLNDGGRSQELDFFHEDEFHREDGGGDLPRQKKKLHPMPLPFPYPIVRQAEGFPDRFPQDGGAAADCQPFDESRPSHRAAAFADWLRAQNEEQERRWSLPPATLEY